MTEETGWVNHVWKIMLAVSVIFILWVLFMMTGGDTILPAAFKLAGSPQSTADIETRALDFMTMTMLKPLWEEIWIGIFGILIALGLKKKSRYALTLGMGWGIMMIVNGIIQGGYELLILGWSAVCLQTYSFLLPGVIVLVSLVVARRAFSGE